VRGDGKQRSQRKREKQMNKQVEKNKTNKEMFQRYKQGEIVYLRFHPFSSK
jgi:lauroyl/myristoyl acyltransferase